MKLAGWVIGPVVILLIGAALLFQLRSVKGTFSTSDISVGLCQANEQIAPTRREEIDAAAIEFVDEFARSPIDARNRMSRRGRAATTARANIEAVGAQFRATRVTSPRVVAETYLLRFSSGSEVGLRVPCDMREGRGVFVGRGGTAVSALVVLKEELPGLSERATSVWLEHEEGEWRPRAISFGLSRIAGLDGEQLWTLARAQRRSGHLFNANMLYVAARSTQDRGSFHQTRMSQDFNADLRTFSPPPLLQGGPPFRWEFGNETFVVHQVQYMGLGTAEEALIIDHAPAAWTASEAGDAINRRLIDGFDVACPEWREIFGAVVARARKPGTNETWGTVFTRDRGYSRSPSGYELQADPAPG